jgi:hypothetical protein
MNLIGWLILIDSSHSGRDRSVSIPFQYVPFRSLKYRPNDAFEWSTGKDILFCQKKQTELNANVNNNNKDVNSNTFWMCVISEEEIELEFGSDYIITLYSPLIVENLLATKITYKVYTDYKSQYGFFIEMLDYNFVFFG